MNRHTLVIRTKNHTGIIMVVAGFFSRRNIHVDMMSCSAANSGTEMIFTVTYPCGSNSTGLIPHVKKMHDVIDVFHGEYHRNSCGSGDSSQPGIHENAQPVMAM